MNEYYCNQQQKMVQGPPKWIRPVVNLQTKEVIRGNAAEAINLNPIETDDGFSLNENFLKYHRKIIYDPICPECGGLLSLK